MHKEDTGDLIQEISFGGVSTITATLTKEIAYHLTLVCTI